MYVQPPCRWHEIAGEGVIGKFPVLTPGAPEFVYQSCTAASKEPGSMDGDFRCVWCFAKAC